MRQKDSLFGSGATTYQEHPRGNRKGLPTQVGRAQVQMALVFIGNRLGYTTCLAGDDAAIIYHRRRLSEGEAKAREIGHQSPVVDHNPTANAPLVGCVWFRNPRLIPAVIEVGDAQTVTGSLIRMGEFQKLLPPLRVRWVIAAPDEDRQKVIQEANKNMFKPLNANFFPYSAVEELCSLCGRRNIPMGSVNEPFLDAYMECCLTPKA